MRQVARGAPLCPAGHLPHKGGDWRLHLGSRQSPALEMGRAEMEPPISPQVGEMSGRTEGGATERQSSSLANSKHFPFRAATFGNITVALAPDRGRSANRRADYHDPTLPPRHALIAFGLWLRKALDVHALVHVGAHGTLEWLPGKTVALSENCFPEIVTGAIARHLSLHRLQPGRGGAGQAAHCRRHPRPFAAAADRRRAGREPAAARAAGRRICPG